MEQKSALVAGSCGSLLATELRRRRSQIDRETQVAGKGRWSENAPIIHSQQSDHNMDFVVGAGRKERCSS